MQHELLSVDPILEPLRHEDRFEAVRDAMEREVAKQRERVI